MRLKKRFFFIFFNVGKQAAGAQTNNAKNSRATYQRNTGAWIFLWHFFKFSIESLLVVYNLNIMQQADYIYASLPMLLFHVQAARISQITVFIHSFWLISPADMSSLSAFIISPIWLTAHFFYGLFYLECKIVVKWNI